ncbi:MAG: glycosyltransferase family 2 protein [Bacteroidales bacterium]|nr:glycosyltransferase family 2 protein [Bacteroidales bacterium]
MLEESFPVVHLIANKNNLGFEKACNQALWLSTAKYALLLNPDTVVAENSFKLCIDFKEKHHDAGALGVRMIDGNAKFLPESKRSLPTPWISFYKIFGLSALFPKSKIFGKYQLKYLDEYEIAEVEVLSGAYMFLRMETLQKTGFLDEAFFMYGEDIDLSYRIIKAGYKNYYFPKTTIIHYKGESTKKGSLNYIRIFYQAMNIYAKKHFSEKKLRWYLFFIQLAIYFRAGISVLKRIFQKIFLPVLDFSLIYLIFKLVTPWWAVFKYGNPNYFSGSFLNVFIPGYIIVWLVFALIKGAYKKNIYFKDIAYGIGYGSIAVLIIYSLLPEHYRFSRFLISLGSIISFLVLIINRLLSSALNLNKFSLKSSKQLKSAVIVGNDFVAPELRKLIEKDFNVIGYFSQDKPVNSENYLGNLDNLPEIVDFYGIERIIFVLNEISVKEIIDKMTLTRKKNIEFIILLSTKDEQDNYYIINLEGQKRKQLKLFRKKAK